VGKPEEEEAALVTEDRVMKEGGRLDASDKEMIREFSKNGQIRVRIINTREMFETLQKEDPAKFKEFHKKAEHDAGIPLTFEQLVDLQRQGRETMGEFTALVKDMTREQALAIRHWRIDQRMSWRRLARECYLERYFKRGWGPPENQLMGMALCEKAASLCGENYQEPPWN
jgi:hypothetical protein